MEGLNRIDENSRDLVRTPSKDVEGRRMKVLESQTVADRSLAAQSRLYAVPPAVVGASEAHDQLPARVKSRQSNRGHNGLGTTHVKGYFVEFRDGFQKGDIVGDHRMERSQNRTKVLHLLQPLGHPILVTVKTGDVEPIGTAYVQVPIAVEIAQFRTLRFRHHRAETELFAHRPCKRKGNPVGVGETQIGKAAADIISP